MAAAAAVLLPEFSMSTSQGADVSLARHRRRQTNRRTGTLKSLKKNGLEDSTLKLSHLESQPPVQSDLELNTPIIQSAETEFTGSMTISKTTENGKFTPRPVVHVQSLYLIIYTQCIQFDSR